MASAVNADAARARLSEALAKASAGDQAALKQIYDATSAKLFGVCLRILPDRGEAEDVLQEVYVTVWRKAGSFDPTRSSPITWLVALARNRAIDRLRASKSDLHRPIEAAYDLADTGALADVALQASDETRRLNGCLDELDPAHAAHVRDAFMGGLSYQVLAERAGAPLGTMKSWIRRALLRLRTCLEQ